MDSLAQQLKESDQRELIEELIANPAFKDLLHREILQFEQTQKTIQMGTGIPKVVSEIYEIIDTIVSLKVKQALDSEDIQWMDHIRKEIEELRVHITESNKRESTQKIDTARSFELDKLIEDKSMIFESLPAIGTSEIQSVKKEVEEIKNKLNNFITQQSKIEAEKHSKLQYQIERESFLQKNRPAFELPIPIRSKSSKRNHRAPEFDPNIVKSAGKTDRYDQKFDEIIDESIKQKFSNYETRISGKYDDKIDSILKSLKFLEDKVTTKKQDATSSNLAESGMMRIDSERSFYSKKSNKSNFASRLVWK